MTIYNDVISKSPDQGPLSISGAHASPGVVITLEGPLAYDESPEALAGTGGAAGDPGPVGDIDVHAYGQITVFVNVESITNTSIQFFADTKMPDGTYAQLAQTAAITAAGPASIQLGIGTGTTANVFPGLPGQIIRLRAVTVGAGTTTFSVSVQCRTDN